MSSRGLFNPSLLSSGSLCTHRGLLCGTYFTAVQLPWRGLRDRHDHVSYLLLLLLRVKTWHPQNLLYFLLHVLHRLVHEFRTSMESSDASAQMFVLISTCCFCATSRVLLRSWAIFMPVWLEASLRAIPLTSTDRISWSELARAATQVEASVARGVSSS